MCEGGRVGVCEGGRGECVREGDGEFLRGRWRGDLIPMFITRQSVVPNF